MSLSTQHRTHLSSAPLSDLDKTALAHNRARVINLINNGTRGDRRAVMMLADELLRYKGLEYAQNPETSYMDEKIETAITTLLDREAKEHKNTTASFLRAHFAFLESEQTDDAKVHAECKAIHLAHFALADSQNEPRIPSAYAYLFKSNSESESSSESDNDSDSDPDPDADTDTDYDSGDDADIDSDSENDARQHRIPRRDRTTQSVYAGRLTQFAQRHRLTEINTDRSPSDNMLQKGLR